MNLAKITMKGQITIPMEVRRKLGVRGGDKVVFLEQDGRVYCENSARIALRDLQESMHGEAEKAGISNEEGVLELCKQVRDDMWENKHADNV